MKQIKFIENLTKKCVFVVLATYILCSNTIIPRNRLINRFRNRKNRLHDYPSLRPYKSNWLIVCSIYFVKYPHEKLVHKIDVVIYHKNQPLANILQKTYPKFSSIPA